MFGIDDMLLATVGSSLISGFFGSEGQKDTNATNIQLAREQMAFQERMSNTAYPRAIQGMKDAGLNPILAYSQGGASSPIGAMPQVQNVASAGVNSAAAGAQVVSAVQNIMRSRAETLQVNAATEKIKSETMEKNLNTARLAAEVDQMKASGSSLRATADNTQQAILGTIADSATKHAVFQEMNKGGKGGTGFAADVARRKAEAAIAGFEVSGSKASSQYFEDVGKFDPYMRIILQLLRGSSSAYRSFK